jgi:copper chaperone CopZ
MHTQTYNVKGMHCASCSSVIEKTFKKVEGEAVNYSKPSENPLVNDAILEINKCKTLEELTKVHNLCAKEVQNDPKFTDAILSQKKILTLIDKKDGNKP